MAHAIGSASHALARNTFATPSHPDAKRIAGLAAAITLNVAMLMLLLVPMSAPPPLALPDLSPSLRWIHRVPVTPIPPVHVPVVKVKPQSHAVNPQRPGITTPIDRSTVQTVIVDHETQPIDPAVDTSNKTLLQNGADSAPLPGVRLEYADAPAPAYPRDALRDGVQGTVLLQVLVDVDGRPLQVDVQRSSGDRRLDIAARKQVLMNWRFRPAMKNGHAVQAIGLVPIAFNLDG
jgi:protein TonB